MHSISVGHAMVHIVGSAWPQLCIIVVNWHIVDACDKVLRFSLNSPGDISGANGVVS
jgi:hypothetical protein